MDYGRKMCPSDVKEFIFHLQKEIFEILNGEWIGFYIHGSLAMGGFNPNSSDIDILVVTNKSMTVEAKRKLAKFLLSCSKSPFPVEISFLNDEQLKDWKHPCPFDFHYSEFWRERYEDDLQRGTYEFLNGDIHTDTDLASHITIMNNRGICVEGKPISEVFPFVPRSDYLSSIMGDFIECIKNIEENPIYSTLNMIRVFWYVKEGVISSKQEAGNWGLIALPKEWRNTLEKVCYCYANEKDAYQFETDELILLKGYILNNVQRLLKS